jgi:putative ABC transport system permease protein
MAWKVLLRRKFFTFISLFGISFTLFVLMVATAFLDEAIQPKGPDINQSRILLANRLLATDTTKSRMYMSSPGYYFLNKYVRDLKTPELISIHSNGTSYFTYRDNKKLNYRYVFTDDVYWKIYKFNFLDGKAYTERELDNADRVAVISESVAREYLGELEATGGIIDVDGADYRVIGVVENNSRTNLVSYSDIWIPATTNRNNYLDEFFSGFTASVLAYSEDDFPSIRNEFHKNLISALDDARLPKWLHILKCELRTKVEIFTSMAKGSRENFDTGTTEFESYTGGAGLSDTTIFFAGIVLIMFLFMLLPSINLVNINLSRMVERSSEIGVRKAFGASRKILVGQFITENVILTFMGSIISVILTIITLHIINNSGLIANSDLSFNVRIFLVSMIICLVFGFVSGVYPAVRMSKLHPVDALRGGDK